MIHKNELIEKENAIILSLKYMSKSIFSLK